MVRMTAYLIFSVMLRKICNTIYRAFRFESSVEAYLKPNQKSTMELFAEIFHGFLLLTIVTKVLYQS